MALDSQSKPEKAFEDMELLSQQREILKALIELAESVEELK